METLTKKSLESREILKKKLVKILGEKKAGVIYNRFNNFQYDLIRLKEKGYNLNLSKIFKDRAKALIDYYTSKKKDYYGLDEYRLKKNRNIVLKYWNKHFAKKLYPIDSKRYGYTLNREVYLKYLRPKKAGVKTKKEEKGKIIKTNKYKKNLKSLIRANFKILVDKLKESWDYKEISSLIFEIRKKEKEILNKVEKMKIGKKEYKEILNKMRSISIEYGYMTKYIPIKKLLLRGSLEGFPDPRGKADLKPAPDISIPPAAWLAALGVATYLLVKSYQKGKIWVVKYNNVKMAPISINASPLKRAKFLLNVMYGILNYTLESTKNKKIRMTDYIKQNKENFLVLIQ